MRVVLATLHSKYIHPSLALPYLAAYCGGLDCEFRIREFTLHEPKESILAMLLAEQAEVVCFSVYLWNRRATLELVDALHVAHPGLRIVLGGPEVSFDGEKLFARHPGLAALVRGEGELPLYGLLRAWMAGEEPLDIPRLDWRKRQQIITGPDGPPLADLDRIPSPFAAGLVALAKGTIYCETSRGCPYSCAFCMSALDARVRSFSPQRIEADLGRLMAAGVRQVKLVDRTFNYDAARARRIWRFILRHNRHTNFHFEIGAHLLTEDCLQLLEQVPKGMFQFEIGVQSTLPETLRAIGRNASLQKLEANVSRLIRAGNIHLHLDLIAGLPGEGYDSFLVSIDRVLALGPEHLQVEPVKLLPGSPLRSDAAERGIRFDPNPPYTVLVTPDLSPARLEQLRTVSRLLDMTWNAGRARHLFAALERQGITPARALDRLAGFCLAGQRLRHPLSQQGVFELLWEWLQAEFAGDKREPLREALGRDYARCERVLPERIPDFLTGDLSAAERIQTRQRVEAEREKHRGDGSKLQFFAAPFTHLPGREGERVILLYLYRTASGRGREVEELWFRDGNWQTPSA
ncbi:B12-binding domain-containing radical SAM protein [Geothermobacter hydrogeniphilus]|uniref:B12-binding domain-containing radical SAM protein n=1 Tax=Geothermobacter hydrogeniphilus TaxID=1969733 RepID=A0A2K2HC14_9BACT|nr:radical SAM protein [Geothermobacter hydrogeniphilus]PNU20773.1 B12-binding domain-containing radical SAM protein [Geothermobacter hydrogeniphilus]